MVVAGQPVSYSFLYGMKMHNRNYLLNFDLRDIMQSKSIVFVVLVFIFFLSCSKSKDPVAPIDEDHFEFILYNGLVPSDIAHVSTALNENYQRIIDDLQVSEMPDVTVKIWADYNHFLDDMENDIGTRYTGATGYIFGPTESRLYFNNQVAVAAVHEFAHLVSMQINSTIPNNPRWLWEAIAVYENNEFVDPRALPYMVSGDYPTLNELNTDYNNSNHNIYQVGFVLLEYIIDTWGMDTVIELIQNNGNLSISLGLTNQEFESGWYQFLENEYLN